MDAQEAVALALSYIDGLRSADPGPDAMAAAFLAHMADRGFIVLQRDGVERTRLKPGSLAQHHLTGAAIQAMREEVGLTKAALAKRAGIHFSTLAKIENKNIAPHARTTSALLDALAAARTKRTDPA